MNLLLRQTAELLHNADFLWSFCGGYAIDLFLGRETRKHGDIDICVFENQRDRVIRHMLKKGWMVYQFLGGGKVRRLSAAEESDPGRNLMCLLEGCPLVDFYPIDGENALWYQFHHTGMEKLDYLEFLFNPLGEDEMNPAPGLAVPLKNAICRSEEGYPYLAPEIALLYKASGAENPLYQQDHALVMPYLTKKQREFFQGALRTLYKDGHPWQEKM